jgi:cobaltochelatase CobN
MSAGRGMCANPQPNTLDVLRRVLLETEGDLDG